MLIDCGWLTFAEGALIATPLVVSGVLLASVPSRGLFENACGLSNRETDLCLLFAECLRMDGWLTLAEGALTAAPLSVSGTSVASAPSRGLFFENERGLSNRETDLLNMLDCRLLRLQMADLG